MHRVKIGVMVLVSCLTVLPNQNMQALAQPRLSSYNLTGDWLNKSPAFYSVTPLKTGCHNDFPGIAPRTVAYKISLIEKKDGTLTIPGKFVTATNSKGGRDYGAGYGKVSGNVLSLTTRAGGFTAVYKGNISKDGNTITGRVFCKHLSGKATAQGPFTFVRLPSTVTSTPPPVPTPPVPARD